VSLADLAAPGEEPLQLYAEEIDTTSGKHLGNFPQAFTHLALIEAVSLLIESGQEKGTASVG
jgi:GH15 family glucan-1,4-alpha-glucosidase